MLVVHRLICSTRLEGERNKHGTGFNMGQLDLGGPAQLIYPVSKPLHSNTMGMHVCMLIHVTRL